MMGKAPMGASPLSVPTGNPGQAADSMAKVREAVKILEQALPQLPTGSDPYKAVLSAISGISKHISSSSENPGVQQTALRDLQGQAQQSGMMQALMRSLGGAGSGPAGGATGAPSPAGAGMPPGGPPG